MKVTALTETIRTQNKTVTITSQKWNPTPNQASDILDYKYKCSAIPEQQQVPPLEEGQHSFQSQQSKHGKQQSREEFEEMFHTKREEKIEFKSRKSSMDIIVPQNQVVTNQVLDRKDN